MNRHIAGSLCLATLTAVLLSTPAQAQKKVRDSRDTHRVVQWRDDTPSNGGIFRRRSDEEARRREERERRDDRWTTRDRWERRDRWDDDYDDRRGVPPGLAKKGGVPPGLAKKRGIPPGQAKKSGYRYDDRYHDWGYRR